MICPLYDEIKHQYMGSRGEAAKVKIQNFTGIDLGSVRATQINNTTYLAYPDVCRSLEISHDHPERLTNRLDREEEILDKRGVQHDQSYLYIDSKNTHRHFDGGLINQTNNTLFISESAFYDLTSRSNKEEAIVFKHWVNSEVLPSIREASEKTDTTREEITNEYLKDALERGINYLGRKIDQNELEYLEQRNKDLECLRNRLHSTEFKVDEINVKADVIGSIAESLYNKVDDTGKILMKVSYEQGRRDA